MDIINNNIDLKELTKLSEQHKLIENSILILTIFIICILLISLIFIFLYVIRVRKNINKIFKKNNKKRRKFIKRIKENKKEWNKLNDEKRKKIIETFERISAKKYEDELNKYFIKLEDELNKYLKNIGINNYIYISIIHLYDR